MMLLGAHGRAFHEACMGTHWKKYETNVLGTWESNPGPNGDQPHHPPLSQAPVFVIIMGNKNNISKLILMLETKKRVLSLNGLIRMEHVLHLLRFPAKE